MNPDQIPRLIAEIAVADPRVQRQDPTERRAQVRMWAGILADVPYDFAITAAQQHYATSPYAILPADIATRWRAQVRDRMQRHHDPAPPVDPDDEQAYRQQLAATRHAVATGQIPPAPKAIEAAPTTRLANLLEDAGQYLPDHHRQALHAALPNYGRKRADRPELTIACPYCRARPNRPCRSLHRGRDISDTHPTRREAWQAQQNPAA